MILTEGKFLKGKWHISDEKDIKKLKDNYKSFVRGFLYKIDFNF